MATCFITMSKTNKKRLIYAVVAVVLLVIEVLIALYVRDNFIRPYFGDVLVVILLYAVVRAIVPNRFPLLPLAIFIFAVLVEIGQYFNYVDLIGLGDIKFFRIVMGTGYDFKDILCYAVGCAVCGVAEILRVKNKN